MISFYIKHQFQIFKLLPNFTLPIQKVILKKTLGYCGNNVQIGMINTIVNPKALFLGDNVFIGSGFYCAAIKKTTIKDRVMFGAHCSIIGGDHKYFDPEENMRFNKKLGDNREITVEEDAWIGHGSLLLKKAHIGEGTIVGAYGVVNQKLKPYSVYAGSPVKFIKPRFSTFMDLEKYLNMMNKEFNFTSNYTLGELKELYN